MSGLGLLLVVLALGSGVARLLGEAAALAWPRLGGPGAAPIALLASALAGAAAGVAALVPSRPELWLAGTCPCAALPGLGVHLCPLHPATAAPLVPLAALALGVLAAGSARPLLALVREVATTRALARGAEPAGEVWSIDLGGAPVAFATGIVAPRVVVDGGWWASLSADERVVVLAHERAHLRARDPAVGAALAALAALVAPRGGRALVEAWALGAELRADAGAARVVGDPVRVAAVLVAVARRAVSTPGPALAGARIEVRVRALLAGAPPPGLRGWALAALPAVPAAVGLGPLLHRAAELVLNGGW